MIDLRPEHLALLQNVLADLVPGREVRAFGSRVAGSAKRHSDLDLAILGDEPLAGQTLTRLMIAFEESELPFRIDIVDWHLITNEFRKVIEANCHVLQKTV